MPYIPPMQPLPCIKHNRYKCADCRRAHKRLTLTEQYKKRERRRNRQRRTALIKATVFGGLICLAWLAFCVGVGWAAKIW